MIITLTLAILKAFTPKQDRRLFYALTTGNVTDVVVEKGFLDQTVHIQLSDTPAEATFLTAFPAAIKVDSITDPSGGGGSNSVIIKSNGVITVATATTIDFSSQFGVTESPANTAVIVINSGDLTKVDDTNVTLTLGGTPTGALLKAASITVGWAGTLAASRGGTGVSSLGDLTKVDDTNVTLTLGGTPTGALIKSASITVGWSGQLSIARGGTGTGSTLVGLVRGSATAMTAAELSGDVTTSGSNATTLANIPNDVPMAGDLLATAIVAPSTPAAGKGRVYVDSTSKNLAVKDDAGVIKHGVKTDTGSANNFLTAIADDGTISKAQPSEANLSLSDITTNDVSTSKHGFAPKAPNDATKFLDGTGAYSVPSSSGFDALTTLRFYEDFTSGIFIDTTNKYFQSENAWSDSGGTFPSVAATATTASTGGTSFTVNLPASISSGDLLIVAVHQRNQQVLTWPAGWTSLIATNGSSQRLEARYKIADGTEGSTITITAGSTTGDATGAAYRITGHDPARTPTNGTSAAGSSANPDPPSVTANANESNLFVEITGFGVGSGTVTMSAFSTNYGSNNIQGSGTNTAGCSMASRNLAAASDDPGTQTITSSTQWVTNTIAVSPLPGGTATQLTNTTGGAYKPANELVQSIVTNASSSVTRAKPFIQSKNPIIKIYQAQDTTTNGTRFFGLVDTTISATAPTNGIYLRHTAAGNYIAVCRSSSVESTLDTGVAAANGTFHKFKLVVTGTTSVEVFVDGVSKGTITTHIPTVNLGFAANTLQSIDLISVEQDR